MSGGSGGGFNLGNAYGAVIIDVSGVGSAMRQAQSMISDGVRGIGGVIGGIGDTITGIGDQMSRLGGTISTFSVPIAAAGAAGLKAAADFDTLLKQIEIFGGVAPDQLETVRQFALKMGADTKYSSSDAAAAMLELLKAGQSLDDTMKSLPEVLNLAATGNIELAQASGIVSSALAIFKLNAADAGRVSNALAQAANATRADVSDLGLGLTNVGPIAAQFGMSIEDTAAVLGVFANNGIMGAEAGTQLKSMLLNMSRPTDKVTGAFTKLGVSLYDSNGNARNFNTVIKELDSALDKLPIQQQNELMQDLAGSYGIVGLNALRASNGIDSTLQAMANAPSAGKVAATFMETFKGSVESLTGSFETLMISGLTPFMNDVAGPLVKNVTGIVNAITDWTQKNPALTKQIVKVLAGVAVLGPGLLVAGKAFSAIGELVKDVGKMFTFFSSGPLGLLIGGIGLLFLAFQTNFLGIRDILEPFVQNFLGNLDEIWGSIQNFGANLQDFGLGTAIASIIDSVMEALGLAANSDEMDQWAQSIGNGIETALGAAVNFIQTVAIPAIELIGKVLGDIWSVAGPALGELAQWFLTEGLPGILNFINTTAIPAIGTFISFLSGIWDKVWPALQNLWLWFTQNGLPWINQALGDFKTTYLDPFLSGLGDLWGQIKPKLDDLPKTFQDATRTAQELVNLGLLVVTDTLNKAAISAGLLVGTIEIFLITSLHNATTAAQGIVDAVQDWVTKNDEVLKRLLDLGVTLLIVGVGVKIYTGIVALAALATGVGSGLAGAVAAAGGALLGIVGTIVSVTLPLLALIGTIYAAVTAFHKLIEARDQAMAAVQKQIPNAAPGIKANNLSLQDVKDKAFQSSVAEYGGGFLGDLQARLLWGSGIVNMDQRVTDLYNGAQSINNGGANQKVNVVRTRDVGGPGIAGMPYNIGRSQLQNEIYIPGANGQFVNDFVDLMKSVAAGVTNNGGDTIVQVQMPAAALANPAGAYAAGQDFGRGVADEMRAQGIKGIR